MTYVSPRHPHPRTPALACLVCLALAPACGDSEGAVTETTAGSSETEDPSAGTSVGGTQGTEGTGAGTTTTDTTDTTGAPASTGATTSATTSATASTTETVPETTSESGESEGTTDDGLCPDLTPNIQLPRQRITAEELGVLVNLNDPQSVAVADYYVAARGIPAENVVELSFDVQNVMPEGVFAGAKAEVDAALGPEIQALALTWTQPYRVACMSATAAFALGFNDIYCNTSGMACGETAFVDYFNSDSTRPYDDHGLRPAMMLAAKDVANAEALIDRGVASDASFPTGDGYLVRTTDVARSVRWPAFISTINAWDYPGEGLELTYVDNSDGSGSNLIEDTESILFYFTGLANVGGITSNTYVPGGVADHLTSYGGQVPDSGQMSVTRWLEAGATASFGTVVEPCNYPTKFPDTTVMLPRYYRGATVIEAYWKSVAWPGEGNFVGEPLAAPWGESPVTYEDCKLTIETTGLRPFSTYELQEADDPDGPWTAVVEDISIDHHQLVTIEHEPVAAPYYRLVAP